MTINDEGKTVLARSEWMKLLGTIVAFTLANIGTLIVFGATLWSDNRVQDIQIQNTSSSVESMQKDYKEDLAEIKQDIRDIKVEVKSKP